MAKFEQRGTVLAIIVHVRQATIGPHVKVEGAPFDKCRWIHCVPVGEQ